MDNSAIICLECLDILIPSFCLVSRTLIILYIELNTLKTERQRSLLGRAARMHFTGLR